MNDTVFTDFTTAVEDEIMMTTARNLVKTKVSAEELIKEWKEHCNNMVRNRNRLKHRDYMKKRWGEHLVPSPREPRDTDTSSITSYYSNSTDTASTYTKQQTNTYEANTLEIVQSPYITHFGADMGAVWEQFSTPYTTTQGYQTNQ